MYAKVKYDAVARRYPSGGQSSGCCGETKFQNYTPQFSQRVHPAVARYCDAIPSGAEADPEMIGEIIRDLHCVFEKTYGRKVNVEARYRNLSTEIEELKDDLACCECCKEELENELIKLHPELKALQFALEEEIQKRACLESIINQLRGQLARADAMLDADCRDKGAMQSRIKDLESQLNKLQYIMDCLTGEKDDLSGKCRQYEDYKVRQDDTSNLCCQRMEQLEEALAKCCKVNEELQKELMTFGKDRDSLIAALEKCQKEKMDMANEFDRQRRQWMEERNRLEETISDLRKAVECLTGQNQEICDKMREVVQAHHREMDNLRREADKYKKMYEQELYAKTKAQEALKACQEELRRTKAECREKMFERSDQSGSGGGGSGQNNLNQQFTNPCAEILAKINGRPWGGGGSGSGFSSGGYGSGTATGSSRMRGGASSTNGGGTTSGGCGQAPTDDSQQIIFIHFIYNYFCGTI